MFQIKHIIRLSFICLFVSIVSCILFYRYFTINNILFSQITKDNLKIAEIYTQQIWLPNIKTAHVLKKLPLEQAVRNSEFLVFVNKSINFFQRTTAAEVELYDTNGNKFLASTEDDLRPALSLDIIDIIHTKLDSFFLGSYNFDKALKQSFLGIITHQIAHDFLLTSPDKDGPSKPRVFIESFIPIIDQTANVFQIDSSIRVITDITEYWQQIRYFEKRVLLFLLVVFSIFFIVILFNTHHAQQIIDQQVASNKALEEAKNQAESENSAQIEFLANVSHELRTPLNAIIGFSEIILSEAHGKLGHEQYLEYIQDINNSGKHLLSVINDILDFSKASVDKLKVDNIEVDLTKLASASLRFVKPRADEAKVQLVENLPKEHIIITADPKRLKQALLNLLSNAVKFTPEEGSVTLALSLDNIAKEVTISVTDTGIGMTEKDIPKVLSGFHQIDNKLSRRYEGTGLGLPLTKKLVELMGGKFEIISQLGTGTIVTLTFKFDESFAR